MRRFGKSYAHPFVVLVKLSNESDRTRIGVAAGKSVGGAVLRNRAKRRIRGVLNPIAPDIASGWDLIFIARRSITMAQPHELEQAINTLLRRSVMID